MHTPSRRSFIKYVGIGLTILGSSVFAQEKPWPDRPIRLIVPYTPGASSDKLGRIIADGLRKELNQVVIVENKPGAGGSIGAQMAADAPPDGYTFVLGSEASHGTNMFLNKNLGYHPVSSFTPVVSVVNGYLVLVANSTLPVHSIAELIQYVKDHPGELSYGSPGIGTPHHLAGAMLVQKAGVDMVHIPYKGGAQLMQDLIGGSLKVSVASVATAKPHIEAGTLRPLAITNDKRFSGMPDVATMNETFPDFALGYWFGLFAPANLPEDITSRVNVAVNKILNDERVKFEVEQSGMEVVGGPPSHLAETVKSNLALQRQLLDAAGISAE